MIVTEAPGKEPRTSPTDRPGGRSSGAEGVVVSGLRKRFDSRRGQVWALDGVTLECGAREVVGIVGPSGCGKSTLLEIVCGLDAPTDGEVDVHGARAPAGRLERCALMPQRDLLLPWRSTIDNAALPLELAGLRRREARRRVAPLLDRFGLSGFARARPHELSGGMRQRVSFLRTLVAGKPVLLLDEPFGSLDSITRARMQEWLAAALGDEPRTVLLVSHDVEEALYLCDRVIVLSDRPGRVRAEIEVALPKPRARSETVTSSEFTALKQRALEALA